MQWDILVSHETISHLTSSFEMKKEDPQNVKGFSKPITVYKVLG
jgi:class 3 adenylate cyclase